MTDPATPTATPLGKPARSRKPRAKPPAAPKVERAKRTTKARTLRVRLAALSPHHVEAYDRARKRGGEAYEKAVREALDAVDAVEKAQSAWFIARDASLYAKEQFDFAQERRNEVQPVMARLASDAAALAALDKEHPTPLLDPDGRDEGAET